jgi:hypothetical protein
VREGAVGGSTLLRFPVLALVAVAVAAAAVLLLATRTWGLGVSYDSVVYVQASHDLSSIDLPQPRDQGGEPLYWWAPAYPVALKLFGGSYEGARILNALLLLLGALLIGTVTWRTVCARAGVTAGALYAFSPAVFTAHLDLLAEPLYLVLATAALASIVGRRPALAGVLCAAASLTRHAGLPLFAAGALVLRGRDRLRFLVTGLALYLAWLARNQIVAGETTGRLARWHPPGWDAIEGAGVVLLEFLVTPGELGSLAPPLVHPGGVAQILAAATLLLALLRADRRDLPPFVELGLVYAVFYAAFVLVSTTFFDDVVPMDERLLVPLVPPLVVAIAWLVRSQPVAAVVLVCLFAVATLQQARTTSLYGRDYSGRIWSAARIDASVLPPGPLYSNWPAAIAYFTDRSPRRFPREADVHTADRNHDFPEQMRELARSVRNGEAALVILSGDFLQQEGSGVPLAETAPFRGFCRPAGRVVTICSRRQR